MKNKIIVGLLALAFLVGGSQAHAQTPAATRTPGEIISRMDDIYARVGDFLNRLSAISDKLEANGRDVSEIDTAISVAGNLRSKAQTEINEFKAARTAAGDVMNASVMKEGREAKQAIIDFLQAVKAIHTKALATFGDRAQN